MAKAGLAARAGTRPWVTKSGAMTSPKPEDIRRGWMQREREGPSFFCEWGKPLSATAQWRGLTGCCLHSFPDALRTGGSLLRPYLFQVIADPQWDRGAPVSVSGDGPVTCIFEPIPKALFPHKFWNPAGEIRIMRAETPPESASWGEETSCSSAWPAAAQLLLKTPPQEGGTSPETPGMAPVC